MTDTLRLIIRTPHETVLDSPVASVRIPTATGMAGLRPRQEPLLLVVEPGLVVVTGGGRTRFAATAGGLLEADRRTATLYTPFAVVGDTDDEVLDALDRVLATPDSELLARRRLGELEQRILQELRPKAGGEVPHATD